MDRSSWRLRGPTEKSSTDKSSTVVTVDAEIASIASDSSDAPETELRHVHGPRLWGKSTNIILGRH